MPRESLALRLQSILIVTLKDYFPNHCKRHHLLKLSGPVMQACQVTTVVAILCMVSGRLANAYTEADVASAKALQDSLVKIEAPIFAPRAYRISKNEFDEFLRIHKGQASEVRLDQLLANSREHAENSLKQAEVTREALKSHLLPREKARTAQAHSIQPLLYGKAEQVFIQAANKIEEGNVKGGLADAVKTIPLFDTAELEAIRYTLLHTADSLILMAEKDLAKQFAYITLDRSRTHQARASAIIDSDRTKQDDAKAEASKAEYEARHASEISQRVRSLEKNNQAWEQLILSYEIAMQKAADEIGGHLAFDQGSSAAAAQLSNNVRTLRDENSQLSATINSLDQSLRDFCEKAGISLPSAVTREQALNAVRDEFNSLVRELDELRSTVRSTQKTLEQTQQEKEASAALLAAREAEERTFAEVKATFAPTEALVLYNASSDIVMRLRGLTFKSGSYDITAEHNELLAKVANAIASYPKAKIIIEGHTDNQGNAEGNQRLSEKRAVAVMNYLRQTSGREATDFQAIGYGAEKPVANSATAEGRAENRRIDVIILK